MNSEMHGFVDALPKAELHIHIEGSFEPELMFGIARRNEISLPYADVDALRRAYAFTRLQDFLDLYYQGMSVLHTEQDFYDLAIAYFEKAASQNLRYAEVFFDPQGHTSRGVAFSTVIGGLTRAIADAELRFDLRAKLILCFLRHLDEADAERTLDEALPYREKFVGIGIGLDSSEIGFPPSKFRNVFRRARDEGFKIVCHAGEEGPPEYVWEALDILGADRIDHGNSALQDMDLVRRLAADKMPLTVCPLSNYRLCGVPELKVHPAKRMLDLGLFVTINSDDPAYFGGYVGDNFKAIAEHLPLSADELRMMARNGFLAGFMDDDDRARCLALFAEC
ncbi:MAG: adenosine deaminase [Parvibaculum sedimenti]|uniref:adenosine deaminase n=1 Tax=Parvibaculum sedimenti TaxID=2608632 RepID=UPI003BB4FB39